MVVGALAVCAAAMAGRARAARHLLQPIPIAPAVAPGGDDGMFEEVLQLLREGTSNDTAQSSEDMAQISEVAIGIRVSRRCQQSIESLGHDRVLALAKTYLPEFEIDGRSSVSAFARRLTRALLSVAPLELHERMQAMDADVLLGVLRFWLAIRLQQQLPCAAVLQLMSGRRLFTILERFGVEVHAGTSKQRLVARILKMAAASKVFSTPSGMASLLKLAAEGDAEEPVDAGSTTIPWTSLARDMPAEYLPRTYLPLGMHLQGALVSLGFAPLRDMVLRFAPHVHHPRGSLHSMAADLLRLLPTAIPADDLPNMLILDGSNLIGRLCHWLALRLQRMPWVGVLQEMTFAQLCDVAATLGIRTPAENKRLLVSGILEAARHPMLRAMLLNRLGIIDIESLGVASVGYLSERPLIMQNNASTSKAKGGSA